MRRYFLAVILLSKFLCWGLMFSKPGTWPQHIILEIFFVIKVIFGVISSGGKARMSTPALRLFRGVSVLVPPYEHWTHRSVPAVCATECPKTPHESSLWGREGNSRNHLRRLAISKSWRELSPETQTHRTPWPTLPRSWTWLPCPWGFLLIPADDRQLKTKHGNRYRPSRPHHTSFFEGVYTKQVYLMSPGSCVFF